MKNTVIESTNALITVFTDSKLANSMVPLTHFTIRCTMRAINVNAAATVPNVPICPAMVSNFN